MGAAILKVIFGGALLTSGACATILSESKYNYVLESEPRGAKITIIRNGVMPVHTLTSPANVILDLKHDYFIKFELEGYKTVVVFLDNEIDLLTIGNVVCCPAGVLVDYLTGSIWKPAGNRAYVKVNLIPGSDGGETLPKYDTRADEKKPVRAVLAITRNNTTARAEFTMRPGTGVEHIELSSLLKSGSSDGRQASLTHAGHSH